MWEVALQLRLAARLYARLPSALRQSFPDAPTAPGRLFLGSARFQRAFWRYVTDTDAAVDADGAELAQLKRALRRSMRRKIVVAALGFSVVIGLVVAGWRPYSR